MKQSFQSSQELAKFTIDSFLLSYNKVVDSNQISFNTTLMFIIKNDNFRNDIERLIAEQEFDIDSIKRHLDRISVFDVYTYNEYDEYVDCTILDLIFREIFPRSSLLIRLINEAYDLNFDLATIHK